MGGKPLAARTPGRAVSPGDRLAGPRKGAKGPNSSSSTRMASLQLHLSWGKGPSPAGEGARSPPGQPPQHPAVGPPGQEQRVTCAGGVQHGALPAHQLAQPAGSSLGAQHTREKLSETPMKRFGKVANRVGKQTLTSHTTLPGIF